MNSTKRGGIKSLILGNGAAQGIQLLSLLILSRIYTPGDFGQLAQVQSLGTLLCAVATLQLHLALPFSASTEQARISVESIQRISFIICLGAGAIAFWINDTYVFAAALALSLSLTNTYSGWLVYSGSFTSLSRFYLIRAGFLVTLQLGLSFSTIPNRLIWATILGELLSAAYLRCRHLGSVFPFGSSFREAFKLAARLRSFSVYGTIQELIAVCAFYAPLVLFAQKFDDAVGGHYALASRLVWAPTVLLSGSLIQVLNHQFGRLRPASIHDIYGSIFGPIHFMLLFLICILSFIFQDLFRVLVGSQWGLASHFFPLHVLWGTIFLLSAPFRAACRALELQRKQLAIDAAVLVTVVIFFSVFDGTPLQFMWMLVLVAFIQNILLGVMIRETLRRTTPEIS